MKRILATTAIVALTATPVLADTQSSDDTQMQQANSAQMPTDTQAKGDVSAERDGMVVHASNLIGHTVYIRGENAQDSEIAKSASEPSEDWERIGEVGDVIISKDGKIDSVVLDAGGFLGIGEKNIRTSMDELKFVSSKDGQAQDNADSGDQAANDGSMQEEDQFFVVFTGDRSQIEDREKVDEQTVRDEGSSFFQDGENQLAGQDTEDGTDQEMAQSDDAQMTDQSDQDMAQSDDAQMTDQSDQDMAQSDDAQMTDQTDQDMAQSDDAQMSDDGMQTADLTDEERGRLTADDLEGLSIYGTSDEQIGEISELVLANDGKITDVVIDVGGFLGIGEKPVALPFDEIQLRRDDSGLTQGLRASTKYTEEELESMESWNE